MKRRKMLRSTTLMISVLVITTLIVGACFFAYRHFSSYNNRMQAMQKDTLINFRTKVDKTLRVGSDYLSALVLDDRTIRFFTEEPKEYYLISLSEKVMLDSYQFQGDCLVGLFEPGQDIFVTNVGVLHSWELEDDYGFTEGSFEHINQFQEKEFLNNFYLDETLSANGERLNLFFKRQIGMEAKEIYGFISLNLQEVAEEISMSDDHVFCAFKDEVCLFTSDAHLDYNKLHILREPSGIVYNLDYVSGVAKGGNVWVWLIYLVLFLLLVSLGIFGSLLLAKRLHRPIENIIKQLSDEDETDIYDEEAYIRGRFVEIESVNRQLESQISLQGQKLKQNFVRDLLYGLVSEEVLQEKVADYGLDIFFGNVVMAVLEENKGENKGAMLFRQITALISAKIENSIVVFLNAGQLAIVARGISCKDFQVAVAQAILQINEWYEVSYIGAVTEGDIQSLKELNRLFNETVRYLQNGGFSRDKLLITKEDVKEREEHSYYYPLEFEKNIISSIVNNEFDRAMQMIQIILEKNLMEMKLSKTALTELKFAFVGTVKRILQILQKTEAELFGEGSILYLELSAAKTADELTNKIHEIFFEIQKFTENTYEHINYALIDQLERYIKENFERQDMSLLLLAEHFNLTTGYISKVFKRYRQINFKDYLTEYRIEKAVEILETTPYIRVSELAERVGYDNTRSFTRNFKKIMHFSPSEYKQH